MKRKSGKRLAAGALAAVMTASPCVTGIQGMIPLAYGAEADETEGTGQEESLNCEALRNKWKILLCGGDELDVSTKQGKVYAESIDQLSLGIWEDLLKLGDATEDTRTCLFSDLPMTARDRTGSSEITLTFDRLKAIVLAYETKGSQLYKKEEVKKEIIAALDMMVKDHYSVYYATAGTGTGLGSNNNSFGNWYDWRIGTPRQLCDLLLLFYDEVDQERMASYIEPIMANNKKVDTSGANKTWIANVFIQCGILSGNTDWIEAGRNGLKDVFKYVATGDGFHKDGSFIQHTNYAYNGGYGKALLCTMAPMMYILNDTPYEISYEDDCQQIFYDMLFEAYEPLIYGGRFMDMVREREISRIANQDSVPGRQAIRSMIMLAEVLPQEQRARAESMIKEWLSDGEVLDQVCVDEIGGYNEYYLPAGVINMALEIANSSEIEPRGALVMHKRYGAMDRVLHLREDFGFTLSMSSTRIKNSEGTNNEGLRLWHIGDGLTYIYNSDKTLYSDNYWATVDHQRLPGTTVNRVENRGEKTGINTFNSYPFAGGTDLDIFGIAGMELKGIGSSGRDGAHGKKSWFMFDDEIVAVGSDISSALDGSNVETIVENRKVTRDMTNQLLLNGQVQTPESFSQTHEGTQWIHLEGADGGDTDVGYYFPGTARISGVEENRTGRWDLVNTYAKFTDHEERENSFVTFWFDHGVKPQKEKYSYVILPGKSAQETEAYNADPDVQILRQDETVHGVRENTLGITGINFFTAGKFGGFKTENPAAVMYKKSEDDGVMEISFSDPTQSLREIRLEAYLPVEEIIEHDQEVEITEEGGITVLTVKVANPRDDAGKSYRATLRLAKTDNMFETLEVGETPENWKVEQGTARVVAEDDGNQALEITGNTDGPAQVQTDLIYPEGEDGYTVEFKIKSKTGTGAVSLLSEAGTQVEIPLDNLSRADTWHQVKVKINGKESTYSLIIDGVYVKKAVPFEGSLERFSVIASQDGRILVDDLIVRKASNIAPTKPMRLSYSKLGDTYVNLRWDESESENPLYYILTINGEPLAEKITENSYQVEGLKPEETYTFTIQAVDDDDNYSDISDSLSITTINLGKKFVINFDQYQLGSEPQYGWMYGGTDDKGVLEIREVPKEKEADASLEGLPTDVEMSGFEDKSQQRKARNLDTGKATPSNAATPSNITRPEAVMARTEGQETDKALYVYSGTSGVDKNTSYRLEKQTGEQTYRFKLYFYKGECGPYMNINLKGSDGKQAVTLMTNTGNVMGYRAGDAPGTTKALFTCKEEEWIDFEITANPETQTFSVSAGGVTKENLKFRYSTPDISEITFVGPKGAVGGMLVDDIVLPCEASVKYILKDMVTDLSEVGKDPYPYGTSFYDLELPESLTVTMITPDGEEEETEVLVNWNKADYDPAVSGLQTIYGTLALAANYENQIDQNQIKVEVEVQKEIKKYSITLVQSEGGTISCDEEIVEEGTEVTVTAEPDEGYELADWIVDGGSTGKKSINYTFTPESDVTIMAVFQAKATTPETKYYKVKIPSPITGGTLKASSTYAKEGTEIVLKAVPDEGFYLEELKVNGVSVKLDENLEYRFKLIKDTEVNVKFAETEKPPVEDPEKPPGDEPEKPPVEEPEMPPVEEPENPPVEEPDLPPVEEPEKPPVEEPEKPPVEEPEKPPVEEPEKPPVDEPEKPPVEEPEKPPVEKPEQPTLPNSRRRWSSGSVSDKRKENAPSYAVTGTWSQDGEDWCFYTSTGEKLTSDWACVLWNGTYEWFYFNADGKMADGWVTIDGETYYLNSNSDGNRGKMLTGWQSIEGKWYYFNTASDGKKGSMLRNTTTPDGYILDENGVWKAE